MVCLRQADLQDSITCAPGYDTIPPLCPSYIRCPEAYQGCVCSPCLRPAVKNVTVASVWYVFPLAFSFFAIVLFLLWYRFRRNKRRGTIRATDIDLTESQPIGRNRYGLMITAEMDGDTVVIKRVVPKRGTKASRFDCILDTAVVDNHKPLMKVLRDMNDVMRIRHQNLDVLLGSLVMPVNDICAVTKFHRNGTLHSLIRNPTVDFEVPMASVLMCDVARGLHRLHSMPVAIYGMSMDSHTLQLDDGHHVVLPITTLINRTGDNEGEDIRRFGYLMYEILYRRRVLLDASTLPPTDPMRQTDGLHHIMLACWARNPDERPSAVSIVHDLERMSLSSFADAFAVDSKRAKTLLRTRLPPQVADAVTHSRRIAPRSSCMMIVSLELVGTKQGFFQGSHSVQEQCMAFMDSVADKHGLLSIPTVDGTQMWVEELQHDNERVAVMLEAVFDAVNNFKAAPVRAGVAVGNTVARVIGCQKVRYVVLGDVVQMAVELCDVAESRGLHVTAEVLKRLDSSRHEHLLEMFVPALVSPVKIPGKVPVNTFFNIRYQSGTKQT